MEVREKMCVHALPVMFDSAQSISSLFSISAVCNISAFAFGNYGGWLLGALNSDFEGGFRMGRVATELMKRLNAIEVWWLTNWFDLYLSFIFTSHPHYFYFFL